MLSHFRSVCFVMWTAALIYATNGAPVEEFTLLDRFLKGFENCSVLNYVVLPEFKSGNDQLDSNTSVGNYLSVPLEICTTVSGEDKTVVPMCNEIFEIIRNLSTCRDDKDVLKSIPLSSEPINIAVQVDTVCEDFVATRSILAQKEKSVAFKLADTDICPMVCLGKFSKACAFLLWGHKVQVLINAGKAADHQEPGSVATKTTGNYQLPGLDKSFVSNLKKSELPKTTSKELDLSQSTSGESKLSKLRPKKLVPPKHKLGEELLVSNSSKVSPKSNSEDFVEGQSSDPMSAVKTSITSTTAALKSSIVSSSSTPENSNIQHVHEEYSEKDANAKTGAAESTDNTNIHSGSDDVESHKGPIVDADGKLPPIKMNKPNGDTLGGDSSDVEKGSKGNATSKSGSAAPEEDFVHSPLLHTSKVSTEDQQYSEEETLHADSAKNEDDPPSEIESTPVKSTLDKNLIPENSAPKKIGTVTKEIHSALEDSASDVIQGTSGVIADEQFGESSDDSLDDNLDQPDDMNKNSYSGFNTAEDVMANGQKSHEPLANLGANKIPAKNIENGGFPEQEDTHFFFYFVTIVIFAIGGYVLFHNKQKIFALIIEGRHERRRRSGASYRKLETK